MRLMSPEQFLDRVLPARLKALRASSRSLHGTCVIRLIGVNSGQWVVDLKRGRVTRGGVARPEFFLAMRHRDFQSMLSGDLDIERAIDAREIYFSGDPRVFRSLSRLLSRSGASQQMEETNGVVRVNKTPVGNLA